MTLHTLQGCMAILYLYLHIRAAVSSKTIIHISCRIRSLFSCKGNICLYNGFLPFPLFYWEAPAPLNIVWIYRLVSLWHFSERPPEVPLCPSVNNSYQTLRHCTAEFTANGGHVRNVVIWLTTYLTETLKDTEFWFTKSEDKTVHMPFRKKKYIVAK